DLAAKYGALLEHGVEHPGAGYVDAEERLAGHYQRTVDARLGMADDLEVSRVLELDRLEVGYRQRRRLGRQLAIARAASARPVVHPARLGTALRCRDAPGAGCRGDQHLAPSGADPAQRVPVQWCRLAAAGVLPAEFFRIERGLLNVHLVPVDIQFLGDEHRQHRLDTLSDLGVLG